MSHPRALAPVVVLGLLLLSTGCAALGLGPEASARRLLEQGKTALQDRQLHAAYEDFAEIRRRYPESPVSREAFPLAASVFRVIYMRERYARPVTEWVETQPQFMLDWFVSLLDGPEFPQKDADALFVGMTYSYFEEYLAYVAAHPVRFDVKAPHDDGIIESVEARLH